MAPTSFEILKYLLKELCKNHSKNLYKAGLNFIFTTKVVNSKLYTCFLHLLYFVKYHFSLFLKTVTPILLAKNSIALYSHQK